LEADLRAILLADLEGLLGWEFREWAYDGWYGVELHRGLDTESRIVYEQMTGPQLLCWLASIYARSRQ
jgi:hypothetical protein